jgi:hypothetical protein
MKKAIGIMVVAGLLGAGHYVLHSLPIVDLVSEHQDAHVFGYKKGVLGKVTKTVRIPIRMQTRNYALNPSAKQIGLYLAHCAVNPQDLDSAGYVRFITNNK